MLILNNILKEIRNVLENRLKELFQFTQSSASKTETIESLRKKILSFGGAYGDISERDNAEYLNKGTWNTTY